MQVVIDITEEEYRRCQDLTNLEYEDVVDFLQRVEEVLDDENCVILSGDPGDWISRTDVLDLCDSKDPDYEVRHFKEDIECVPSIIEAEI